MIWWRRWKRICKWEPFESIERLFLSVALNEPGEPMAYTDFEKPKYSHKSKSRDRKVSDIFGTSPFA